MARLVPFIYSTSTTYKIEFNDYYARFLDSTDAVIASIGTPYPLTSLNNLDIHQLGDTIWIVHPSYAPRKLTRTSTTTFSLDMIPFTNGPFLTRNDLINPNAANSAYMVYTGSTGVGSSGRLSSIKPDGTGAAFFASTHIGSIFKLTTKRTNKVVNLSTASPNISSATIDVKGTYTFTTTAFSSTNIGEIALERSENGSDWETVRSDTSNIQYSGVEERDNVMYRARTVSATVGGTVAANITVADPTISGVVKVTGYVNSSWVTVEVLSKLDPVEGILKTKRWAEGAWSDYRTWPSSVTFFGDRCIYTGMNTIQEQAVY